MTPLQINFFFSEFSNSTPTPLFRDVGPFIRRSKSLFKTSLVPSTNFRGPTAALAGDAACAGNPGLSLTGLTEKDDVEDDVEGGVLLLVVLLKTPPAGMPKLLKLPIAGGLDTGAGCSPPGDVEEFNGEKPLPMALLLLPKPD